MYSLDQLHPEVVPVVRLCLAKRGEGGREEIFPQTISYEVARIVCHPTPFLFRTVTRLAFWVLGGDHSATSVGHKQGYCY